MEDILSAEAIDKRFDTAPYSVHFLSTLPIVIVHVVVTVIVLSPGEPRAFSI